MYIYIRREVRLPLNRSVLSVVVPSLCLCELRSPLVLLNPRNTNRGFVLVHPSIRCASLPLYRSNGRDAPPFLRAKRRLHFALLRQRDARVALLVDQYEFLRAGRTDGVAFEAELGDDDVQRDNEHAARANGDVDFRAVAVLARQQ